MEDVFKEGFKVLEQIRSTQGEKLRIAGEIVAKAFMENHKFFVSGSGHSRTLTEEFYARAGGLAFVVPILTTELTMTEHPTKSSYIERLSGYAEILAELYGISNGDVIIIASNSGRNAYPIEMAIEAHKRGAYVIAITNKRHSDSVTSRHKSGKKLIDLADLVIDNCGVVGDCAISIEGLRENLCPTSSMANSFIAQSINVECAKNLIKNNVEVPVFSSLNCDGNEDHNEKYFHQYTRMY